MTKTSAGIQEQPTGWTYEPAKGFKTTRTYKGTGYDNLVSKQIQLMNGGWGFTVKKDLETGADCLWELTATRGGGDASSASPEGGGLDSVQPLADTWEMASNLLEKDLLESDSVLLRDLWTACAGLVGAAPFDTQEKVFAVMIKELKSVADNPEYEVLAAVPATPAANKIGQLLLAGVHAVRVFQPTLRHNKVVTDKFAIRESLANCGNIITADSIGAVEGIPQTLLFNLPTKVNSDRSDYIGVRLKYGWYKKYPNVGQRGDEWEISQEFEWGLWHRDLYNFIGLPA